MYNKDKRIQGGSSFADAVFRFNASPEDYAKRMFHRVIEKEWGDASLFRFYTAESYFIITKDEKPMIINDYEFVEKKRCEDVHGFEKWVYEMIKKTEEENQSRL